MHRPEFTLLSWSSFNFIDYDYKSMILCSFISGSSNVSLGHHWFFTVNAGEKPDPGMNLRMIQSVILRKWLQTLAAFVGFLSCVYSQVDPQCTNCDQCFLTFCALVIFLSSVCLISVVWDSFFSAKVLSYWKHSKRVVSRLCFRACMNFSQVRKTSERKITFLTWERFQFLFVNSSICSFNPSSMQKSHHIDCMVTLNLCEYSSECSYYCAG